MTELVVDASVVLKWFGPETERHSVEARRLRADYEAGRLVAVVPSLLFLELLNVAGRRWQWSEAALLELGRSLADLGLEVREPSLDAVARWVARGLTAYDAAYVALAEAGDLQLVTDDDVILEIAAGVATLLAGP